MSDTDTPPLRPRTTPSRARGTRLSCELEVLPANGPPITVLHLAGEIDAVTQPLFETALATALLRGSGPLVVDLAGLTFCSARGLGFLAHPVLATTSRGSHDESAGTASVECAERVGPGRAESCGDGYALAGLVPALRRAAVLVWPADHPAHYPTTVAAVVALHARHLGPGRSDAGENKVPGTALRHHRTGSARGAGRPGAV